MNGCTASDDADTTGERRAGQRTGQGHRDHCVVIAVEVRSRREWSAADRLGAPVGNRRPFRREFIGGVLRVYRPGASSGVGCRHQLVDRFGRQGVLDDRQRGPSQPRVVAEARTSDDRGASG